MLVVWRNVHGERAVQRQRGIAHRARHILGRLQSGDVRKIGLRGLQPGGVDRLLVHEGIVEVAQLGFLRRQILARGKIVDEAFQPRLVLLVDLEIHAGIAAVRRNLGGFQPATVAIGEEIVARFLRGIHIIEIDAPRLDLRPIGGGVGGESGAGRDKQGGQKKAVFHRILRDKEKAPRSLLRGAIVITRNARAVRARGSISAPA